MCCCRQTVAQIRCVTRSVKRCYPNCFKRFTRIVPCPAIRLLREQGEHPLVVSTNLGHSDIQVTLNTYSHVTPTLQRRAAEAMDEVLGKELIESRELVAIP